MKPKLTLLTVLLLAPLMAVHAAEAPKSSAPAANLEFPADWFLYGMAERDTPEPDFTAITDIPATLDAGGLSLSAKATRLERCRRFLYLDLQTRHGGAWVGRTAYLLTSIDSDADRNLEAGAGANRSMKIWCNGRVVCDTLADEDEAADRITHRFTPPLRKGRNLLAVKVVSGGQGFQFLIGGTRELAEIDAIGIRGPNPILGKVFHVVSLHIRTDSIVAADNDVMHPKDSPEAAELKKKGGWNRKFYYAKTEKVSIAPDAWRGPAVEVCGKELSVLINARPVLSYTTLCGDVPKTSVGGNGKTVMATWYDDVSIEPLDANK